MPLDSFSDDSSKAFPGTFPVEATEGDLAKDSQLVIRSLFVSGSVFLRSCILIRISKGFAFESVELADVS